MSILEHFPGTPRLAQTEILSTVEAGWREHDCFIVSAPVAVGKSPVAVTLASWRADVGESVALTTHNNVLVDQYLDSWPNLPVLHRRGKYGGAGSFQVARDEARRSPVVLANYYTYVANQLQRQNLIVDEAHNLLGMLRDRWSKKLWQRQWEFPDDMVTFEDFLEWAETKREPELTRMCRDIVASQTYTIDYDEELWRGKPDKVLKLIPLTVRDKRPWLWNHKVRKIVLMSATISEWEIYELGLDSRRWMSVNVDSPIPAANRPVLVDPVANMSWATRSSEIDRLATRLRADLVNLPGKGVIHATYDTAARLRSRLGGERRLIWHNRDDRQDRYQEFRASPAHLGRVFVASGFSEGIDLAYDAARWQVICEIPFPSLGDPAVKIKATRQPDWCLWECTKTLLQTIGRVCRAPDDFGETRIYDNRFEDFLEKSRRMWPQHVISSMRFIR